MAAFPFAFPMPHIFNQKRTYQPSVLRRKRKHGYLKRLSTSNGRNSTCRVTHFYVTCYSLWPNLFSYSYVHFIYVRTFSSEPTTSKGQEKIISITTDVVAIFNVRVNSFFFYIYCKDLGPPTEIPLHVIFPVDLFGNLPGCVKRNRAFIEDSAVANNVRCGNTNP